MREGSIQALVMIELQLAYPNGVFYRRNVGKARDPKTGRVIRFGIKGQADVAGIINGRAVEVEVKTDTGRQSKEQQDWQRAVERAGGIYIIARSPASALEQLRGRLG